MVNVESALLGYGEIPAQAQYPHRFMSSVFYMEMCIEVYSKLCVQMQALL